MADLFDDWDRERRRTTVMVSAMERRLDEWRRDIDRRAQAAQDRADGKAFQWCLEGRNETPQPL
ncbi:MAG: hypothetical protein WAL34_04085 [Acidobacteriaceae bacterium]